MSARLWLGAQQSSRMLAGERPFRARSRSFGLLRSRARKPPLAAVRYSYSRRYVLENFANQPAQRSFDGDGRPCLSARSEHRERAPGTRERFWLHCYIHNGHSVRMAERQSVPRLSINPESDHAFHELGSRRFEHFARALHTSQPGIFGANLYAPDGQEQFGIDHVAFRRDDGGTSLEVGQAKAEKRFSADDIRKAADKFLFHWDTLSSFCSVRQTDRILHHRSDAERRAGRLHAVSRRQRHRCGLKRLDGRFVEMQIKARSKSVSFGGGALFAALTHELRETYWFVFYSALDG